MLPESQQSPNSGGGGSTPSGGSSGTVTKASAVGTLPFTGSNIPLVLAVAVGLLGLGVGLRRMTEQHG